MKLLDILNENTEYLVKYTVLKDKDFSRGTASYKDEADAKKFFTDLQKDDEVISATLRKKVGPDSSMNAMGGMAKHLGSEYDLDRYTHPAYYKKGELEGQEKNIKSFLNSPQFLSKKRGFTNKDGSDPYFQEGLEEGINDQMMQDIINDPNRRVYDLVDWFNHSVPMFEKDWDAFMYGRYEKFLNNKDAETKAKMYKVLQKMANK